MDIRPTFTLRHGIAAGATALCLGVAGLAYAAGGAAQEVKTADTHAGFAAAASSVNDVHMHLHHVLNCLEGSAGKDFAISYGDPCAGMGSGAINDTTDATQKATLEKARSRALEGLAASQLAEAQAAAKDVDTMLKGAM